MIKMLTAGMLAGALALSACATKPLVPPSATVAVAQGETTLEATYHALAGVYLSRAATMDPALKARLKVLLADGYKATLAAQDAERLGNAADLDTQVRAATALFGQVKTLLGVK